MSSGPVMAHRDTQGAAMSDGALPLLTQMMLWVTMSLKTGKTHGQTLEKRFLWLAMKAVVLDPFIHLQFIQRCCQQMRLHVIIYTTNYDR